MPRASTLRRRGAAEERGEKLPRITGGRGEVGEPDHNAAHCAQRARAAIKRAPRGSFAPPAGPPEAGGGQVWRSAEARPATAMRARGCFPRSVLLSKRGIWHQRMRKRMRTNAGGRKYRRGRGLGDEARNASAKRWYTAGSRMTHAHVRNIQRDRRFHHVQKPHNILSRLRISDKFA